MFLIIYPEEKSELIREGPWIRLGLIATSSNFSPSGRFSINFQAALSANVLLLSYGGQTSISDQSSSVYRSFKFPGFLVIIARQVDVKTTLFILYF